MTLETLQSYPAISRIYTGMLQLSGMDDFVTSFQTFAPLISSDIISYYNDNSCSCKNRIIMYTELYRNESIQFLYDYATQHDLGELIDNLEINTAQPGVDISGRVATTTIADWYNFTTRIKNAQFRTFSTVLSGDNIVVLFA